MNADNFLTIYKKKKYTFYQMTADTFKNTPVIPLKCLTVSLLLEHQSNEV